MFDPYSEENSPWTLQGMYLATFNRKMGAASFVGNFLHGVLSEPLAYKAPLPESVTITANHHYFSMVAHGYSISEDFEHLSDIFDIRHWQQQSLRGVYRNLLFLKPIVWFTQFCIVDVINGTGSYQQAFNDGIPSTQPGIIQHTQRADLSLGVNFTLSSGRFEKTDLPFSELKQAMTEWYRPQREKLGSAIAPVPKVTFKWQQQTEYCYSLKLDFIHSKSEQSAS